MLATRRGGHLIVSVNYNTDIGDAWEYADAPEYPEHMTTLAYRYGLNYLVYSHAHQPPGICDKSLTHGDSEA